MHSVRLRSSPICLSSLPSPGYPVLMLSPAWMTDHDNTSWSFHPQHPEQNLFYSLGIHYVPFHRDAHRAGWHLSSTSCSWITVIACGPTDAPKPWSSHSLTCKTPVQERPTHCYCSSDTEVTHAFTPWYRWDGKSFTHSDYTSSLASLSSSVIMLIYLIHPSGHFL